MSATLELDVQAPAHGGHCVARLPADGDTAGRVVFVRHALPGERVRAVVTAGREGDRYWRADAVEVLRASPRRVRPPCPLSGPGGCGGCDFQHVSLAEQRRLKAAVVTEQLARLGGVDVAALTGGPLLVEPLPVPDRADDGLGWRSRVRYAVDPSGRLGFRRHRSHEVVPVAHCPLVTAAVAATGVTDLPWPGAEEVGVAAAESGTVVRVLPSDDAPAPPRWPRPEASALVTGRPGRVTRVSGRTWLRHQVPGAGGLRVTGDGFWQAHVGAAACYADALAELVAPGPDRAFADLYAGAGLLTCRLAAEGAAVVAVEGDRRAAADLRRNLHDRPRVTVVADDVERALARGEVPSGLAAIVLDPPRSGAGGRVVAAVAELRPDQLVYLACDPASLGRDTGLLAAAGYRLRRLRAFDAFPMTHHVECLASFEPH